MINFIPRLITINNALRESEAFASNLANKSLAAQLNTKFASAACSDHPTYTNEMEVHFVKEGDIMTVKSYCCQAFKAKLDLLCQNKNPFEQGDQAAG